MPASADDSGAGTDDIERLVLRLMAAVILFVLAAGVASVLGRVTGDGDPALPGESEGSGQPSWAGPVPGTAVAAYLPQRARVLAAADGPRAAVVSFDRYLTPAEVPALLGDHEPRLLLVAAPGGHPAAAGDVVAWARQEEAAAAEEVAELERLLPTVEDPEFEAAYRADLARLAHLAAGVDPSAAVAFGAVVVAPAEDLRALARRAGIRLVDVAAGAVVPPPDRVAGLRPEEVAAAGRPPTRPL